MFDFFKRKEPDVADALTNQTIGGQSVLYRLFRGAIGCEDSTIRRLELTYFAATVMTYVYLRFGKQANRDEILDRFTRNILTKSIPSSKEAISFGEAVKEYQSRYAEYNSMLSLLFTPSESGSGNPAATLLMHAFERITESSAHGHMIHIVAASGLIQEFVNDHINFVKDKL
jgi:hypothetical protein